jgi:hypothetical protein
LDIRIPNSHYIKIQNTHYDNKSEDPNTGDINPKYKVCANILKNLDVYAFFVSTSQKASCPSNLVVSVETDDWIDRTKGHLEKSSYLSATHIDVLADHDITEKRNDPQNGFFFVGKLPDCKYNEMIRKYAQNKSEMRTQAQETASLAFSNILRLPEETIQRTLENLGIS